MAGSLTSVSAAPLSEAPATKGKVASVRSSTPSGTPARCRIVVTASRAARMPSSPCSATNSSTTPALRVVAMSGRSPRAKAANTASRSCRYHCSVIISSPACPLSLSLTYYLQMSDHHQAFPSRPTSSPSPVSRATGPCARVAFRLQHGARRASLSWELKRAGRERVGAALRCLHLAQRRFQFLNGRQASV